MGAGAPARVQVRVLSRAVRDENTGCLLSTYAVNSSGYAKVSWREEGRRPFTASVHRIAWEAAHGPIPEGWHVHHKCFTRNCINVQHLDIMEGFENGRRVFGQDWPLGTCRNGHPNSELATVGKSRRCLPCYREKTRRASQKRRERRLATAC